MSEKPQAGKGATAIMQASISDKSQTPANAKRSLICASCKRGKLFGNAFCNSCYYLLPYDRRKYLFRPINDGFEGAYESALEWLTENKEGKK